MDRRGAAAVSYEKDDQPVYATEGFVVPASDSSKLKRAGIVQKSDSFGLRFWRCIAGNPIRHAPVLTELAALKWAMSTRARNGPAAAK